MSNLSKVAANPPRNSRGTAARDAQPARFPGTSPGAMLAPLAHDAFQQTASFAYPGVQLPDIRLNYMSGLELRRICQGLDFPFDIDDDPPQIVLDAAIVLAQRAALREASLRKAKAFLEGKTAGRGFATRVPECGQNVVQ